MEVSWVMGVPPGYHPLRTMGFSLMKTFGGIPICGNPHMNHPCLGHKKMMGSWCQCMSPASFFKKRDIVRKESADFGFWKWAKFTNFTIFSPYFHHMFTICSPYFHHIFTIFSPYSPCGGEGSRNPHSFPCPSGWRSRSSPPAASAASCAGTRTGPKTRRLGKTQGKSWGKKAWESWGNYWHHWKTTRKFGKGLFHAFSKGTERVFRREIAMKHASFDSSSPSRRWSKVMTQRIIHEKKEDKENTVSFNLVQSTQHLNFKRLNPTQHAGVGGDFSCKSWGCTVSPCWLPCCGLRNLKYLEFGFRFWVSEGWKSSRLYYLPKTKYFGAIISA